MRVSIGQHVVIITAPEGTTFSQPDFQVVREIAGQLVAQYGLPTGEWGHSGNQIYTGAGEGAVWTGVAEVPNFSALALKVATDISEALYGSRRKVAVEANGLVFLQAVQSD